MAYNTRLKSVATPYGVAIVDVMCDVMCGVGQAGFITCILCFIELT